LRNPRSPARCACEEPRVEPRKGRTGARQHRGVIGRDNAEQGGSLGNVPILRRAQEPPSIAGFRPPYCSPTLRGQHEFGVSGWRFAPRHTRGVTIGMEDRAHDFGLRGAPFKGLRAHPA